MKRLVVLVLILLAVVGLFAWRRGRRQTLVISTREAIVPADGAVHRLLLIRTSRGRIASDEVFLTGLAASVIRESDTEAAVEARSAVNPGAARLSVEYRGKTTSIAVHYVSDSSDRFGDGTPDFLRLHSAQDRAAFRGWFTAMADQAALLPRDRLPQEIGDCAALLRWCYRNALHAHDEAWMATVPLEVLPPLSSVGQYVYPITPLGANIFRVRPGAYSSEDVSNRSFAQFADARTLWQLNTYFLTRDVRLARPGDLLFYRQLEQNSPYHSMILTGSGHDWAVYHTGPIGPRPGEVRRVALDDLIHHPDTRWRPIPQNSNFLGVYRWNILREDPR